MSLLQLNKSAKLAIRVSVKGRVQAQLGDTGRSFSLSSPNDDDDDDVYLDKLQTKGVEKSILSQCERRLQ
jgi:hypothetical protein